jgi:hypothetical protein
MYSGRELYKKTFDRLQNQMFLIKKSAPKDKRGLPKTRFPNDFQW